MTKNLPNNLEGFLFCTIFASSNNNTMVKTRLEMMELLRVKYPNMLLKTTEEFYTAKKDNYGIWICSDEDLKAKDGFLLFNYNGKGRRYEHQGIHKEVFNFLRRYGWYAEWYDCGTVMLWRD